MAADEVKNGRALGDKVPQDLFVTNKMNRVEATIQNNFLFLLYHFYIYIGKNEDSSNFKCVFILKMFGINSHCRLQIRNREKKM